MAGLCWLTAAAAVPDLADETRTVDAWRQERRADLTGEEGWLTLVGLFWLDEGDSSFGRAGSNRIVLDHPALPAHAGTFVRHGSKVRFEAAADAGVTHDGKPVTSLAMVADTQGEPTVLASGSLRFFLIERSGKLGVRVRDVDNPARRQFGTLTYFPIDPAWAVQARFDPYTPHRRIRIVNILGLEEEADSPGAVVFERAGRQWRLDTVLESPQDKSLFVMFADATSGKQTYGGGRFLRVPLPQADGRQGGAQVTQVDFNEAYNPPCAFNQFATCPVPPYQNRLTLAIEAGEKIYGSGHPPDPLKPR